MSITSCCRTSATPCWLLPIRADQPVPLLLFLALGLAVASVHQLPLWIPENGFASLNPPLGLERLGSLSTRTTHPAFLQNLAVALTKASAHAVIENPFAQSTKGGMYLRVVDFVGGEEASAFFSKTHSCAWQVSPASTGSTNPRCDA